MAISDQGRASGPGPPGRGHHSQACGDAGVAGDEGLGDRSVRRGSGGGDPCRVRRGACAARSPHPRLKGNIDHIAVGPSGVYVIDAKKYTGQIEARNVGGWLREDFRLYVNGRDQTKLADAMGYQVDVVRQAMGSAHSGVPVVPVLCFVAATWPGFRLRSFSIRGVAILWPIGLAKFVTRPVEVTVGDPAVMAQTIGRNLRSA